jgi:hypothetical protein
MYMNRKSAPNLDRCIPLKSHVGPASEGSNGRNEAHEGRFIQTDLIEQMTFFSRGDRSLRMCELACSWAVCGRKGVQFPLGTGCLRRQARPMGENRQGHRLPLSGAANQYTRCACAYNADLSHRNWRWLTCRFEAANTTLQICKGSILLIRPSRVDCSPQGVALGLNSKLPCHSTLLVG